MTDRLLITLSKEEVTDLVHTLKGLCFIVESVAHLQGQEGLLPVAEKGRAYQDALEVFLK